jgi:hypothetical protein
VRTLGLFRAASKCVCAGEVYIDLTSAVSGSAIRDGVDAGLLKTVFFGVLFKRKKNAAKSMLVSRAPFVFGSGWLNLTPPCKIRG